MPRFVPTNLERLRLCLFSRERERRLWRPREPWESILGPTFGAGLLRPGRAGAENADKEISHRLDTEERPPPPAPPASAEVLCQFVTCVSSGTASCAFWRGTGSGTAATSPSDWRSASSRQLEAERQSSRDNFENPSPQMVPDARARPE